MQLPDENIEYQFQRLLAPLPESWTPLVELQSQHFLQQDKLDGVKPPKKETMERVKGILEQYGHKVMY